MSHLPDTHAESWALLPWLANGRLEAGDREWVDAHVAGCAECRAELAAQCRVATELARAGAQPANANDEEKSFNKLWARIDAVESSPVDRAAESKTARHPASRTVRWLAAAVVVQAIGLGVLGSSALRAPTPAGDFTTVADAQPRLNAPAVRVVFAPQASIADINTLLTHQGLTLVAGPGTQGNFTAVLSADAVASGASADSIARVISKDPNVSFAQPVAR
jgi:predicted anti-sigma-YlaC factor YlaD